MLLQQQNSTVLRCKACGQLFASSSRHKLLCAAGQAAQDRCANHSVGEWEILVGLGGRIRCHAELVAAAGFAMQQMSWNPAQMQKLVQLWLPVPRLLCCNQPAVCICGCLHCAVSRQLRSVLLTVQAVQAAPARPGPGLGPADLSGTATHSRKRAAKTHV
jgi:hypothetical protein